MSNVSPRIAAAMEHLTQDDLDMDHHDAVLQVLSELRSLTQRIEKIESDAQDMMSPDKMMEIAGKFLGGGL
jgi:hypothetical protein